MDRKEFLIQLWSRLFKFLIIIIAILGVAFIVSVVKGYDTAYFFNDIFTLTTSAFYVLMILLFFVLLYCIKNQFDIVAKRLSTKLSNTAKLNLKVARRIADYISILVLGALIYIFWMKNTLSVVILLIMVAREINAIIKEEKQKSGL